SDSKDPSKGCLGNRLPVTVDSLSPGKFQTGAEYAPMLIERQALSEPDSTEPPKISAPPSSTFGFLTQRGKPVPGLSVRDPRLRRWPQRDLVDRLVCSRSPSRGWPLPRNRQ